MREVGDLYDPIAEDKQVTLRVASESNATVYCDRDLFFEAVANLVDNAVKFTPAGGASRFPWSVAKTKTSFGSRTQGEE